MNKFITWDKWGYGIRIGKHETDQDLIGYLNIDLKEYMRILGDHNAKRVGKYSRFYSRIDCDNCIKALEKYIIMKELMGNL